MKRETALALHLRYLTLKLRALCWVLRRLRRGAGAALGGVAVAET